MGTDEREHRFYEKTLPWGYREALTVDAGSRNLRTALSAAAAAADAVLFPVIFFAYAMPRLESIAAGFSAARFLLLLLGTAGAYLLYVPLHELTHGAVYALFTGRKLTFGFRPPAAFCGVPGIYTYRAASMASLLAPFTLFTLLYTAAFLLVRDPLARTLILFLAALHLSGCVGDLYGLGLYLFRFRDPSVLREDSGPRQVYYVKGADGGSRPSPGTDR